MLKMVSNASAMVDGADPVDHADADDHHYLKQELDALFGANTALMRFFGESCFNGLWFRDLDDPEHQWISPGVWRALGYDPAGKSHRTHEWRNLIDPDDYAAAEEALARHYANPNEPFDQLYRCAHRDGAPIWIRCRAVALGDETGRPYRLLGLHTDVSELKRREAELQTQSAQLQAFADLNAAILASSQAGVMSFAPIRDVHGAVTDFRIISVNPAAERLTRRWASDLIGRGLLEEFPGVRETGLFALCSRAAHTGKPVDFETHYRQGGVDEWFRVSAVRAGADGFTATFTAVTELKRHQIALRKLHELGDTARRDFQLYVERLLELGRRVFGSEFGCASHLRGDECLVTGVSGDGGGLKIGQSLKLGETLCAAVVADRAPRAFSRIEDDFGRAHPTPPKTGWRSYIGAPLIIDGEVCGTISFASAGPRDREFSETDLDLIRVIAEAHATQLKLREAQGALRRSHDELRFILDNAPARIWYKDDASHILRLNRAAAESMGLEDPQRLEDADSHNRFPAPAPDDHQADLDVIRAGEAQRNIVEPYTSRDGAQGWVSTDKIPMRHESGERRLLVVSTDITEQKQRELQLEVLNKSLQDFAFVAAHDLQTPLRQAGMYATVLQEELQEAGVELNEEIDEALHGVLKSVKRMREMVKDLYRLSRLSAQEIELHDADMRKLVDGALEQVGPLLLDNNAKVEIADLPVLSCDAGLMTQLFQNLIANACKYRSAADPVIRISYELRPEELSHRLIIEDNGVGIPPEAQEKIFEPFKRLHHGQEIEGAGIGLALCRRVASMHSGALRLDTNYANGARFMLDLPTWRKERGLDGLHEPASAAD